MVHDTSLYVRPRHISLSADSPERIHSCLHLWNYDSSMTEALEVAKMFLPPVDTLTAMFPCQGEAKQPPDSEPFP